MKPETILEALLKLEERSAVKIMQRMPTKKLTQVLNLEKASRLSKFMAESSQNGLGNVPEKEEITKAKED